MTVTTSPTGLGSAQRTQLERLVTRARAALEADLAAQAEGRFGIHVDGTIENEQALPDDASDRATRRDLVEIIDHVRSLGESEPDAVARLLREAAFTHFNRLLAIRIAEAIGLLPESLGNGRQSRGFKDLGEIMPLLGDDYWGYLLLCGDELAADAPALFDPRNPLLALAPSTPALQELVALLGDREVAQLWLAPDTLGWGYQFFNTGDERRLMREGAAAPRTSRELAVRNQFFTPRYVVDFLVQNTLGRRLIESDPSSPLLDDLPLLVDPASEAGATLDLQDATVLDPACGSGHFLLGCYDLLERVWELQGVPPAQSAPSIVTSLCGVDIDPRCAQVASAVIVLRARRHCRDLPLPRPNIVTARGLPGGSASLPADVVLTPEQRQLVDRIGDVLADAPLLGTLLKAEVALEHEVRHAAFGGVEGALPMSENAFAEAEVDLMAHLQAVADRASSSVGERLLAAEADDALRLVEIVRRRYDVVMMNPPFGEPVPETKPYLRAAYPWIPTRDHNLLAAFVGRGIELCNEDGYVGAITSRAGFFLTTFEQWRSEVVLSHLLVTFLDLGSDVMQGAMVEAAAYVIGAQSGTEQDVGLFVRMLKERDRPAGIERVTAALRQGHDPDEVVRVPMEEIRRSPAGVFAYWDPSGMRPNLVGLPRMEMDNPRMQPRVGLQSSDDTRFVRTWWEVAATRCGVSRSETQNGRRWVPLAKGGEYSPYYSDFELVVNWEDDGRDIRAFEKSKVQNEQHYFSAGLTWPGRTVSAFAPQVCPPGIVPSVRGPLCRADDPRLRMVALAWLNSRPVRWVIESSAPAGEETKTGGTAARDYTVGGVQRIPWIGPRLDDAASTSVSERAEEIVDLRAALDETDETTRRFVIPGALRHRAGSIRDRSLAAVAEDEDAALSILERHCELDRAFLHALHAQPTDDLDRAVGPQVAALPRTPLLEAEVEQVCSLYVRPLSDIIEAATSKVGMARHVRLSYHVVDRRLETLAIAFDRHPEVLAAVRRNRSLLPPHEPKRTAEDLLSYVVGAAFGRWDVRIGRDPSLAPPSTEAFDLLPICPPAMLANSNGFPVTGIPPVYPLAVPGERLLVDEPGHKWDIAAAAVEAARAVADDSETLLSDALEIVGRKTLRDYLRKQFFRDHLSRYSKSRRKAPIYWHLSVPSRNWGVWVYAPALCRETLYALAREAARRERLGLEAITRLQGEQTEPSISSRKVAVELDAEEKLAEELRRFREEAERVAGLGWEPDLDDGLVLCAAPLADLFPGWPDAKRARDELLKGQYEWAGVARWAPEL